MKKNTLLQTFLNAFKGLFFVFKTERNFQIEFVSLLVNIILIFSLSLSKADAAIILILCFSVLSAEIFNTAIEKLADFVEPKFNSKIGIIKDLAAAAVLLLAIGAVIIGSIIYLPYLQKFI